MLDPNTTFASTETQHAILSLAEALENRCYCNDHHELEPATRALFVKCYRALRVILESYDLADRLSWDPQPGCAFKKAAKR